MAKVKTMGSVQVYDDKFKFVEAKKFVSLKGPLSLKVVHDSMYPLWRYGHELVVAKVEEGALKKGLPVCFWRDEIYHPCFVKELLPNGNFTVFFLNSDEDFGEVEPQYLLGQIVSPKIGLLDRLKISFRA